MPDTERGRLCSIGTDGKESLPYIIRKNSILFGSGDSCEIRIYVVGVAPEHCLITFDEAGKGFLEPVSKHGLTFLNGEVIDSERTLKHKDVITVVKRSFRFFYPSAVECFVRASSVHTSDLEGYVVADYEDYDPDVTFKKRKKEGFGKRVTFGPSLSPEEFDRGMPPSSPLRRGSLPCENMKKVSEVHLVQNPSKSIQSTENSKTEVCSDTRPLFSEILKKQVGNPFKTAIHKNMQKISAQRFPKKALKFKKECSRSSMLNSGCYADARYRAHSESIQHHVVDDTHSCCLKECQDFKMHGESSCTNHSFMPVLCDINEKPRSMEEEDQIPKNSDGEDKGSESLLSRIIYDTHRLGEHSANESLKGIRNDIESLASDASISCMSNNVFSCPDICMDNVKKLALTISMVNAFHMYNNILSNIPQFPLHLPSSLFQRADDTKCTKKSGAYQGEEKIDFQQLAWFQNIIQNCFSNSWNGIACGAGDQCVLRSYENPLNSDVLSPSVCQKKKRESRSTSEAADLKTLVSEYRARTCENQLICYEASWMNDSNMETNEPKAADVYSNRCSICKVTSSSVPDKCRHPLVTDETKFVLPGASLNHVILSKNDRCCHHQHIPCVQNACSHPLDSDPSCVNSRQSSNFSNSEKLINVRRSFGGFIRKHKYMLFKRKSLAVSCLRRGKIEDKSTKEISNDIPSAKIFRMSLSKRKLGSRKNAAWKKKKAKSSLILQKYGSISLKNIQGEEKEKNSDSVNSDVSLKPRKRKKMEDELKKGKIMKTDQTSSRDSSPVQRQGRSLRGRTKNQAVTGSCEVALKGDSSPVKSQGRSLRGRTKHQAVTENCKVALKGDSSPVQRQGRSLRGRTKKQAVTGSCKVALKGKASPVLKPARLLRERRKNQNETESCTVALESKSPRHNRKTARRRAAKDWDSENLSELNRDSSPVQRQARSLRGRTKTQKVTGSCTVDLKGNSSPVLKPPRLLRGRRKNQKVPGSCTETVESKSPSHKRKTARTRAAKDLNSENLSKLNGKKTLKDEENAIPKKPPAQRITRAKKSAKRRKS